ncbi:MAG: cyclic nucleotide-binding domain-containing protein [Actinomycetota bacterium]|nr:cyclic nucleotide-binding domain-containing protein [Actinomycetota bacterium]
MAEDRSAMEMLGSVGLFKDLSDAELREIAAEAKEVEFEPGRNIVTEGEVGVGFHMILDGRAKVTQSGRDVSELGPGDYFGDISLIDRGPRSATVTAETEVRTLSLISWDFLPLVERNPSIASKLLTQMCKRLRAAEASLTH